MSIYEYIKLYLVSMRLSQGNVKFEKHKISIKNVEKPVVCDHFTSMCLGICKSIHKCIIFVFENLSLVACIGTVLFTPGSRELM